MKFPLQPIEDGPDGVARFVPNRIVKHLLSHYIGGMNDLADNWGDSFDEHEWEQFAQLIGYSIGGFRDLSYVSDDAQNILDMIARGVIGPTDTVRVSTLSAFLGKWLRELLRLNEAGFHLTVRDRIIEALKEVTTTDDALEGTVSDATAEPGAKYCADFVAPDVPFPDCGGSGVLISDSAPVEVWCPFCRRGFSKVALPRGQYGLCIPTHPAQ